MAGQDRADPQLAKRIFTNTEQTRYTCRVNINIEVGRAAGHSHPGSAGSPTRLNIPETRSASHRTKITPVPKIGRRVPDGEEYRGTGQGRGDYGVGVRSSRRSERIYCSETA